MSSFNWSPLQSSGGGVPIYANLAAFPVTATQGDLGVAADTGNLYEWSGAAWQLIGGPAAALSLGNLDSLATSAKGANLVGGVLAMQSASATLPGVVNTAAQSFAGNKTFTGTIAASNLSGTNTGDVTLGTANGLSLVGQALSLALSSTSTVGALSAADWNTFNGKQAAGNYITALTGDATASGPGSAALTLATVNSNVGSFGLAASVSQITVNAKGLITAAADVAIQIAESQVTNLVSDLAGKQPVGNYITALTGDATASGPGSAALTLATVNSNVGSFGGATSVSAITVNAKGLVTAAASTSIQIAQSQVTNLVSDLAGKQATGNYITALTGDATASGPGSAALTLTTVNSNVGTFGSATKATVFTVNAKGLITAASEVTITAPPPTYTAPKVTRYLTGSGQHTLTGSPLYIKVTVVGQGGGGSGGGSSDGGGSTAGSNSTWSVHSGAAILTAAGGSAGVYGTGSTPGGAVTIGGAATNFRSQAGGMGQGYVAAPSIVGVSLAGGFGGDTPFFGGAGRGASASAVGTAGVANTGGGGQGGGCSTVNCIPGSGGGSGGYIEAYIFTPSASYDYLVGESAGAAGNAGTNGSAGAAGGKGIVIVEEFYQ